jgi:rfaE bifunctional protein kinase chain/domain
MNITLMQQQLSRIQGQRIAVIGDLILDRYIWGRVDRISPEAPVAIVEEMKSEDRLGGAANVVTNLVGLGCQVDVYGVIGADFDGSRIFEILSAQKAGFKGVIREETRPTTCKTRILGGSQQMLRVDRESRLPLEIAYENLLIKAFSPAAKKYASIVISDYGKGIISERLLGHINELILDSCQLIVDPHPVNFDHYLKSSIIKPNKKEAEAASGIKIEDVDSAFKAASILLERWKSQYSIITLGAEGMIVLSRDGQVRSHVPSLAQKVFDVSGAGDCVTAVFAAGLASQIDILEISELSNVAAGIVVSEIGTAPITRDKLEKHFKNSR